MYNLRRSWVPSGGRSLEIRLPSRYHSLHVTLASSEWSQLWTFQGMCVHSSREASPPLHFRLFMLMVPSPLPKKASPWASSASPHPTCRHTTLASLRSQASSHTVPHQPSENTSTRPSHQWFPFTSLSCPGENPVELHYPESPAQLWHSTAA